MWHVSFGQCLELHMRENDTRCKLSRELYRISSLPLAQQHIVSLPLPPTSSFSMASTIDLASMDLVSLFNQFMRHATSGQSAPSGQTVPAALSPASINANIDSQVTAAHQPLQPLPQPTNLAPLSPLWQLHHLPTASSCLSKL